MMNDNDNSTPVSGVTFAEAAEGMARLAEAWAKYPDGEPDAPEDSPELAAAKRDIAALLWLNGNCEYCAFGRKEEYSGAVHWSCSFEPGEACTPEWRGMKGED